MTSEIFSKIKELLRRDPFNVSEEIAEDTVIKQLEHWDSFKHLMFLVEIEKEFMISITPLEVHSLLTVRDLVNKIRA